MAFGKKYYSSYKSNNNINYYLEIWLKDYDSTASEITIGAGGPVITYETEEDDRFSPILSSNCRLPLMVTNTLLQTFVSQLRTTYQEKQVYLHLYKATSSTYSTTKPIWSGFLTMDLGSGEDVSFPYEQELIFVDGLSLLKEIDFVDFSDPDYETRTAGNYAPENMYWGPARYTYWIKEILLKSGAAISGANGQGVTQDYGFTTAVNWYNGTMTSTSQSSDPLYLTECKASMFHTKDENETFLPDNCYDVLKELLRHWGARITYWKHEFWIVQIPEYIVDESGFIDNPDNINSRQYNKSGTYLGSQDHLGDTYSSRYEQTIQSNQISKLVGTKYNYLPAIHRVNAKFLSLNGENHFGGFPFGANPYGIDFFQSRINNPSSADFLWVSIPLNWKWDMSGTALPNGHTNGWWARIRFNLYCTQNNGGTITTYYLQYKSSDDSYYWVDSSNWSPLGNESPAYIISSRNLVETDYIGFQEQIEFVDSSGSNIALTGDWDFYMSIENYGTSANNPGSFYCRFSGYSTGYVKRNPSGTAPSLPAPGGGGASTGSGTVSWSNSLQDNSIAFNSPTASATNFPSGYNTGASQVDKAFTWKSPLKGFLQVLSNTVNATYGITNDTIVSNSSNTEVYGFGDLLWGDSIVQTARGNLNVWNGSAFTKTNVNGKWGRGTLTGEKTFTQMLIDEFLTGQIQVVISPSMRLVVGEQNKNQTATASGGGTATRPRYVNPIGRLRETRSNETDPEYFFRRGSFHTLYDEWDYEGYQILRDTITVTTNTNDIGGLGGSQDDNPIDAAKVKSNVETALMMNSPVAYVRTTVPATGSNVIVNGNFNVATGWTLGTGWTIDTTTKKAKFAATGSTSDLVQSVLTAELTYQINFTVEVTAGSLIVKAGSTGTSQTITTSGDYSIYLDCEGSTDIKFTAGTTFTGTITYITAKDQKSISSIPINVIGSTVFKTNDTLDLINSRDGEIMTLNVSSNQGASDDTISVTSTPLYEDVAANSVLLINQDDLSAQYQNKTKGTVGGFDITATSIDSGSVAISSYIDDDTFATASATSLATSESIKAYVDTQVGSADTLQEVTDNGNTTTNSIMIGSSSSPSEKLEVSGNVLVGGGTLSRWLRFKRTDGFQLGFGEILSNGELKIGGTNVGVISFYRSAGEVMRINGANVLIGTTTDNSSKVNIATSGSGSVAIRFNSDVTNDLSINNYSNYSTIRDHALSNNRAIFHDTGEINLPYSLGVGLSGLTKPSEKLHVVGDILATGDSHADAYKPAVSGNPIKFKNFDSSTEFARITDSGNVLIGGTVLTNAQGWGKNLQIINSGSNGASLSVKDSNNEYNLATYGGNFLISDGIDERLIISGIAANAGQLQLPSYGSGSFTGTETYFLAVTSGGDVVEADSSALPGGPYLPLTGGTLTGSLTGTTATFSGQVSAGTHFKLQSGGKLYSNASNVTLQSASGSYLGFNISTSEKMRLNSTGLGIGTTSPSYKLDVSSDIRIQGSINMYGFLTNYSGDLKIRNLAASNDTIFQVATSLEAMRIKSNGNVGINQQNPTEKLHVVGDALITGDSHADAFKPAVSGNPIKFKNFDSSTEFARITDGGNVLIGTTTDNGERLQVNGNARVVTGGNTFLNIHHGNVGFIAFKDNSISSPNEFKIQHNYSQNNDFRIARNTGGTDFVIDNSGNTSLGGSLTGTTATFDGGTDGEVIKIKSNSAPFIRFIGGGVNRGFLQFTGSTAYLSNQANGDFHFRTNNTDKLTIKAGGNVLIGTTTDSGEKLQVNGTAVITDNLFIDRSSDGSIIFNTSGVNKFLIGYDSSPDGFRIYNYNTSSASLFIEKSTNNLGIGTSSPANLLHVYGGAATIEIDSTTNESVLNFDNSTTTANIKLANNDLKTELGGSEKMRILANGNVGIGTTNSAAKLEVYSSSLSNSAFTIYDGLYNFNFGWGARNTGSNYLDIYRNASITNFDTSSNGYNFNISGSEKMRLTSGGFLGLGASSPASKLDIHQGGITLDTDWPIKFGPNAQIEGNTSGTKIRFDATAGFNWTDGGTTNMQLLDNGSLLLGTTTDAGYKLDVSGSFRASQESTFVSNLLFPDNAQIKLGSSQDLQILHNGSTSIIQNNTGDLLIQNLQNDGDIEFKSDDGFGSLATYLSIDGGQSTINVFKTLLIGTTTNTGAYKIDVAGKQRVQDTLELDDVLMLNAISTPSDPAAGKSVIYMDSSDGGIKCKINVGGTVVTRTIASFE